MIFQPLPALSAKFNSAQLDISSILSHYSEKNKHLSPVKDYQTHQYQVRITKLTSISHSLQLRAEETKLLVCVVKL